MTSLARRSVLALALLAGGPLAARAQAPESAATGARVGTLAQTEIAVRLETDQVEVRFLPLEEDLLSLLAPDAARSLRALMAGRRAAIDSAGRMHGVVTPGVALVSFRALLDGARFSPDLVRVLARGGFRQPIAIVPLGPAFGAGQLSTRATASAIYLFDEALPVFEPMTVEYEGRASEEWSARLPVLQRERARVMGRGGS